MSNIIKSMERISHRFVPTNGIHLHIAEVGSGPSVVLLHGFPEIWYSWRHQMLALADAGFHAIAPDLRGYGLSQNSDPSKKGWVDIADDIVGLLDAIGEDKVYVIAKDWGAFVAYYLGYAHPERVIGIIAVGIPFIPPSSLAFNVNQLPEGHYVRRWARSGVPEADFRRFDVATVIKKIYILFCNSDMPIAAKNEQTLDLVKDDDPLPPWMTEDDLRVYADLYGKSTFEYPMQVPYRCLEIVDTRIASRQNFVINRPVLLILGGKDYAIKLGNMINQDNSHLLPQLKVVHIEDGNHFVQEQFPQEVNEIIIEFLGSIST